MLFKLKFAWKRRRYVGTARNSPVASLYDQPAPRPSSDFFNSRLLVVDCEMTGLNPARDHLLSIGWVTVEHGRIFNASARHLLVHAESGAGASTMIHGLNDARIAGARSAATALLALCKQIPGSIVVFHHAPIDLAFLQKAAWDNFRCPLLFGYLDTMHIEKRRLHLQDKSLSLRLADCRQRYGLPSVLQHNALTDARATAELLLAQAAYLSGKGSLPLRELGLRCSG